MPQFHTQLALDYFQARARAERTRATLTGIVAHLAQTYGLGPDETAGVQADAARLARQRGLLPED